MINEKTRSVERLSPLQRTSGVQVIEELVRLRREQPRARGLLQLLRAGIVREGRVVRVRECVRGVSGRRLCRLCGGCSCVRTRMAAGISREPKDGSGSRWRARAWISSCACTSGSRSSSRVISAANDLNFFCPGAAPAPTPALASASFVANFSQKEARVRSVRDLDTSGRMAVEQERTTVQPYSLRRGSGL